MGNNDIYASRLAYAALSLFVDLGTNSLFGFHGVDGKLKTEERRGREILDQKAKDRDLSAHVLDNLIARDEKLCACTEDLFVPSGCKLSMSYNRDVR